MMSDPFGMSFKGVDPTKKANAPTPVPTTTPVDPVVQAMQAVASQVSRPAASVAYSNVAPPAQQPAQQPAQPLGNEGRSVPAPPSLAGQVASTFGAPTPAAKPLVTPQGVQAVADFLAPSPASQVSPVANVGNEGRSMPDPTTRPVAGVGYNARGERVVGDVQSPYNRGPGLLSAAGDTLAAGALSPKPTLSSNYVGAGPTDPDVNGAKPAATVDGRAFTAGIFDRMIGSPMNTLLSTHPDYMPEQKTAPGRPQAAAPADSRPKATDLLGKSILNAPATAGAPSDPTKQPHYLPEFPASAYPQTGGVAQQEAQAAPQQSRGGVVQGSAEYWKQKSAELQSREAQAAENAAVSNAAAAQMGVADEARQRLDREASQRAEVMKYIQDNARQIAGMGRAGGRMIAALMQGATASSGQQAIAAQGLQGAAGLSKGMIDATTTRAGQDMRAKIAERGQDITAQGQQLQADTTLAGHKSREGISEKELANRGALEGIRNASALERTNIQEAAANKRAQMQLAQGEAKLNQPVWDPSTQMFVIPSSGTVVKPTQGMIQPKKP